MCAKEVLPEGKSVPDPCLSIRNAVKASLLRRDQCIDYASVLSSPEAEAELSFSRLDGVFRGRASQAVSSSAVSCGTWQ